MSDQTQGWAERLRQARELRGKSADECALAMGVAPDTHAAFEAGRASPSLPQLELFAYFLDVPLGYFWGRSAPPAGPAAANRPAPAADVSTLRDRIIGIQLRQAREASRQGIDDLAGAAGISTEQLAAYEWGRRPVPLPDLEALASRLGLTIEHFFTSDGPVGDWDSLQRAVERVRQLSPELRDFLSRPANESYLRLAHQLSQFPVERLRRIAESLLDITY